MPGFQPGRERGAGQGRAQVDGYGLAAGKVGASLHALIADELDAQRLGSLAMGVVHGLAPRFDFGWGHGGLVSACAL